MNSQHTKAQHAQAPRRSGWQWLGLLLLSGGLLWLAASPARAEDIDIYSGLNINTDKPNVLFIWDNSANWGAIVKNAAACSYDDTDNILGASGPIARDQGTKFAIEKCALYNTVAALPMGDGGAGLFNVGILLMNETGGGATGMGAYPRLAFTETNAAGKRKIKDLIAQLDITQDKGSNADYGAAMYEAYLYYKGKSPWNGLGTPRKYDTAAFTSGLYATKAGTSCAKNYIIVIGNGSPQLSAIEKTMKGMIAGVSPYQCSANPALVPYGPTAGVVELELGSCSGLAATEQASATDRATLKTEIVAANQGNDQYDWVNEMSRLLTKVDVSTNSEKQGINTYAIAVLSNTGSDGTFPALMDDTAFQGGTSVAYKGTSVTSIKEALLKTFNNMQAANSVFTSASLPVSVNARGTYLNQVYMGMFRPDAFARPRWNGNVKQYKFSYDATTDSIYLSDTEGKSIISAGTGFIVPDAVSAWTTASTFWKNELMGTPLSASDSPDGEVVEKGGGAQRMRETFATSRAGRKTYTCINGSCATNALLGSSAGSVFDSNNTAITNTLLGVSTDAERQDIVNWIRGDDNKGDEKGPNDGVITVRPSLHGDVLHSRPAVVNYGGTTGVVLYYGTNGGTLQAVSGNPTIAEGGGQELWSFVPEEALGKLKRLRDNYPYVRLSTTPAAAPAADYTPRDYVMDGPIGVYQYLDATNTTTKARIYVGMRRGGRAIYAFDVTKPAEPRFVWKRTNTDSGFSVLGQTWSEPKVAWIKGYSKPVIIMGAGYDAAAEDQSPPAATTMGNAVLIIDSETGELLKTLRTDRSVAADVTLMDIDIDGKIDRAYAVDVGGNIYRIDFETDTAADATVWGIYKLASMNTGSTYQRKFFYPVDVVQAPSFVAVLGGTGDREKPLTQTTSDAFFTVYDTSLGKKPATTPTAITTATMTPIGTTDSTKLDGCYLNLTSGEKVVNAATTALGYTYFSTNKPTPPTGAQCRGQLGTAKVYSVPLFCNKDWSSDVLTGGGLPPSPVTGFVTVRIVPPIGDPYDKNVAFIIGAPNSKHSAIEGSKIVPKIPMVRRKSYWYVEGQK